MKRVFYPQDVLDDIRMGNDIVDVIGSFVKLKRSGSSYVGLCPFHKEKTPSFSVNRDNQFFHCFGCGASGNVFGFLMQHQNYSFQDAVKYLADRINYKLPEAAFSPDYEQKKQLRKKLCDIHKTAARFYYEKLNSTDGKFAAAYLDERRISRKARIKYGLGYAPVSTAALYKKLVSEGYENSDIEKSGLVVKREDGSYRDKFFNRLMFPIINVYGDIIGFGGRVIGQGEPKYLNSPETEIFSKSKNLYSLNFARLSKMREFILVEGYMDVISIYQAGFHNVVAALGTAFNENHAKTLKAYADSVILLFDSDAAGVKAVLRAIPVLDKAGIRVKVLQVTDAKDPDEYIKKFGPTAFGKLLSSAQSQYSFLIDNAAEKYDLTLSEDKISYANEVAKIISSIDNAIEADYYIKDAADKTGISAEAIKSVISSAKGVNGDMIQPAPKPVQTSGGKKKGVDEARKSLICLMTSNRPLCEKLRGILAPEDFCDEFYITMVRSVYNALDNDRPIIAANIASSFEDAEQQQRAAQIFIMQMRFDSPEELYKAAFDQIKLVKESCIDEKINKCSDPALINALIKEKRNITELLRAKL